MSPRGNLTLAFRARAKGSNQRPWALDETDPNCSRKKQRAAVPKQRST